MKKILVIEDEISVRQNLVELLNAEGYQAIEAKDGEEGVSLAWEQLPDLILCDISMPRMDGFGVLSRISRDPATATIPFVFLTARVERDDLRRGMSLGADDFITKPFSIDEILSAIETRLQKRARITDQVEKKLADLSKTIQSSLPGDLLSPLSVIISTSELLSNQENVSRLDMAQVSTLGAEIHRAAGMLLRTIQNYMLYSELEAIQIDPKRLLALRDSRVFSASLAVGEVAELKARQENRADDLILRVEDAPLRISEMYLQRIVEELLDVAFRNSISGSPVEVLGSIKPEWGQYSLRVTDQGRGIPPEQVALLAGRVQPGKQAADSLGSELGLVIVKRLVELHQGTFMLQSQPKQTTFVEFRLPLSE
jgi:CheY-like chemotaxis protein